MFDLFRSRAKAVRILLGFLLVLVALSMVTYLIPGVGMDARGDAQVVAEFGKEILPLVRVQQVVQQELRGQSIPPGMAGIFVPQIANQLITEHAVAFQAERMGFRVSEADLAKAIRNIFPQLFAGNQQVSREQYAAILAQQNLTIPQFEETLRKQLLIEALRRPLIESVTVSAREVEQEFHARNDKLKIEYVAVAPEKLKSQAVVGPEEIKTQFESNRAAYQIPERRSLDVVVIDQAKLAASVSTLDSELRRAYEQNKETYRVPERVHVRHILLKTTDAPKEQIAKIEAKAQDLLKQLKGGADFAALAKKTSEDTVSAAKGGDLSWVVRGQTVKAFEDAAFTLKPSELSGVIKTEYGFHILQVLEKQEAHLQTFDEVKARLAEERSQQLVFDRMQTLADNARAALAKDPRSAPKVAAELGLQLVRAEKIRAGDAIPDLDAGPELHEAVSSLRQGEVSPVVQIAPTKLAVAAVTEIVPARQAELLEVESQIRDQLQSEKVRQLVEQRAKELFEKAKSLNGDLKKAAQAMGLEAKTSAEFSRDGNIEGLGPTGYVSEAFKAAAGELLGPAPMNQSQLVYKVVAKVPADASQLAAERETLVQQLKNSRGRARVELFEESLRQRLIKEGKIKVHQDAINRLITSYRGS